MKQQAYGFLTVMIILMTIGLQAQSIENLKGKIIDEHSTPIAGASVHLLNTNKTIITNAAGVFSLGLGNDGKYIIEVTAVGFAATTKELTAAVHSAPYTIVLHHNSTQLDEVIVSAQKREEVLQQLPVSITAITSGKVQDLRLWDIKEITGIVPGLYSSDPGDKRNVTSVRGLVTTSYDPAVATYVDGVNQFSLDTYISPLFDVERIEVLRGPQGSLYGRNAMGGVINIITKQPTNQTSVFAEASYGNYAQKRLVAGFRTPVIKDKLFLGVAGLYHGTDGYYTNQYNNTQYDRQHTIGGNYYLKYLPGKRWDVTLNFKHDNNRNNGPFPLVTGKDEAFATPFLVNQNATTKMIDNTLNASLSINHTGGSFNFQSQTAYQSNYRYYTNPIDADFSPIDGITLINNYGKDWNTVKVLTQEFRFANSAASLSPLQWTAGTYLFYQNNPVKQATHFGNDAAYLGAPDTSFSLINTTKAKSAGAAVYAQATYRMAERLDVIAGMRYDYENKKQDVLGEYQKDPSQEPLFPFRTDTVASANFHAVSPRLGITYHLSAEQLLFASYSRGFRAGGLTPLSSDPSQPALFAFKPEYSNNIEAGIKNTFLHRRLSINITAFYTTVRDAQVPTLVLPDAVTITRNTGKLSSKGIETEINATPVKGLYVMHSFGYTDARFEDLKLAQNGNEADLKGHRQIFTPDLTSMLVVQYSRQIGSSKDMNWVVSGAWKYLGMQYFDLANTIKQTPYSLFNARAGVYTQHYSLFVWEQNLFDTKYIGYAYDFGAVHLGDPRTYGVTISMKF